MQPIAFGEMWPDELVWVMDKTFSTMDREWYFLVKTKHPAYEGSFRAVLAKSVNELNILQFEEKYAALCAKFGD
jgi:hypothetical protein